MTGPSLCDNLVTRDRYPLTLTIVSLARCNGLSHRALAWHYQATINTIIAILIGIYFIVTNFLVVTVSDPDIIIVPTMSRNA